MGDAEWLLLVDMALLFALAAVVPYAIVARGARNRYRSMWLDACRQVREMRPRHVPPLTRDGHDPGDEDE